MVETCAHILPRINIKDERFLCGISIFVHVYDSQSNGKNILHCRTWCQMQSGKTEMANWRQTRKRNSLTWIKQTERKLFFFIPFSFVLFQVYLHKPKWSGCVHTHFRLPFPVFFHSPATRSNYTSECVVEIFTSFFGCCCCCCHQRISRRNTHTH